MTTYPYPTSAIPRIPPLEDTGSTALRLSPIPVDSVNIQTDQEDSVRYDDRFFKKIYELYKTEPDQEQPIRQYIDTHPVLLNALIKIHPELHRYFGNECVLALTIFVDPEEAFERLFIEIMLKAAALMAFNLRREFYKQCFSEYSLSVKSNISIDIRLQ